MRFTKRLKIGRKGFKNHMKLNMSVKSGGELWCLISATPIYDYNGKHIGNMTMQTDITERKMSEKLKQELLENEQQLTEELQASNEELQSTTEELHQHMNYLAEINKKMKQSEEKFFKAFNSNPAPMSLSDGHVWIDVNESFLKLTGYSKEELIGHTPAELNFVYLKA